MPSQIGSRLVFENAKSFIQSQGFDVSQAVLTQSYVRSEVAMSATASNYRMPIVINDNTNGPSFSTEKRVNLQDIHVVSSMAILLATPSSSTAVNFPLYSYPSLTGFTSAQYTALMALYNGSLQITVNNQTILPNWDIFRHYFVPQTQAQVGITAQTVFPIDQNDGSSYGFVPVEPNLLLNGAANIVANLNLPGAISTVVSNSRIILLFRTILAQNVTSVK
jgi:hypothetical protein